MRGRARSGEVRVLVVDDERSSKTGHRCLLQAKTPPVPEDGGELWLQFSTSVARAQWLRADPKLRDLHQAARKHYRRTSATASGVME